MTEYVSVQGVGNSISDIKALLIYLKSNWKNYPNGSHEWLKACEEEYDRLRNELNRITQKAGELAATNSALNDVITADEKIIEELEADRTRLLNVCADQGLLLTAEVDYKGREKRIAILMELTKTQKVEIDRLIGESVQYQQRAEKMERCGFSQGWYLAHDAAKCGHPRACYLDPNWGTEKYCGEEKCIMCQLTAESQEYRKVLKDAGESVCSLQCPSTWKTGSEPPHSELCKRIREILK